jgi:mannose-6-phosphate isomerase
LDLPTQLEDELQTAKAWLIEAALPFWAGAGFDDDTGLFVERTDFEGRQLDVLLRLMVQSRQIYVFAHATLLGWFDGREIVQRALQALLKYFATGRAEAPFAFSVDAEGKVIDSSAGTYGYAFLLFALAWSRRLLGAEVEQATVSSIIAFLQSRLRHQSGQGFVDALPRRNLFLRQNPQMHMLEACLEVADAFDRAEARAICDDIVRLFETRLFSSRDQALVELHDDRWEIADPAAAVFEPGHHFEWIWLLERYRIATGRSSEILISALAQRAEREGIDNSGTVIEQVRLIGGERVISRRCWATCEGLKAAASDMRANRDRAAAERRASRFLQALRLNFLSGPFPGGWIDRIDAEGRPLLDYVPASTLYHLMLAIAEADRAVRLEA